MVIRQGEVRWAHLGRPAGSEPGYRRPVVVVQGNPYNRSRVRTAVCVALTSNLGLAEAPGNVLLSAGETELPRDSVANVSQVVTLDREALSPRIANEDQAAALAAFIVSAYFGSRVLAKGGAPAAMIGDTRDHCLQLVP